MNNIVQISSFQNDKIKKIIKLRNKNKRDKYKLFLIEGYKEILLAFNSNIDFESLFFCKNYFLKDNENRLIDKIRKKQAAIYECSDEVFEKISYRDRPDGLLAIAKQFDLSFNESKIQKAIKDKTKAFIVVLESIEKPGNLGTILRTCDAANADCIIIAETRTDIFNPNVVRASIGTLFTVPIFISDSRTIIDFLRKNKIEIISATPKSDINYTKIDFKGSVAIAFGTEQVGLSDIWFKDSDKLIKIPMLGKIDSLNVAQSTTILLYETIRQRNFKR
jgi:RNA methyltransferase, TrmH family